MVFFHLLLHFIYHRVVDGLICFLVGKTEPSTVKLTLLRAFATIVEFLDRQQYHGAWLLDCAQRYLDFLVIVNFEHGVSNIVQIDQGAVSILSAIWVDFGELLTLFIVDDCFWVVLGNGGLVEGIVGCREAQFCDAAGNLAVEKFFWPVAVFNGVALAFVQCFVYQVVYVRIELFFLLGFYFVHRAVLILPVFPRPGADFTLYSWIEKEMDDPLVNGFDCSRFRSLVDRILNGPLDRIFLFTNLHKLICTDTVLEICRMSLIDEIVGDRIVHPVLEVDIQLVFEGIPPMLFISQMLHGFLEIIAQKVLGDIETLELLHGLDLLHSSLSSVLQGLVLLLDQMDFAFHLLLPVSVFELATFCILIFKFPNFFHLMLLFDFLCGLLN